MGKGREAWLKTTEWLLVIRLEKKSNKDIFSPYKMQGKSFSSFTSFVFPFPFQKEEEEMFSFRFLCSCVCVGDGGMWLHYLITCMKGKKEEVEKAAKASPLLLLLFPFSSFPPFPFPLHLEENSTTFTHKNTREKPFLLLFSKEFVKKVKYFSRNFCQIVCLGTCMVFPPTETAAEKRKGGRRIEKRRKDFIWVPSFFLFCYAFPGKTQHVCMPKRGIFPSSSSSSG